MIKNKMNIKYGDRHDKMNAKCYKPSTYARRTPSATSIDRHPSKKNVESYKQVHHLLEKNSKCYQRGHHLSEVNAKCYQQRASSSTSQESSIPKHYYIEYDWALSKFDTSSANMHSNSEYDAGTEGHHQDADINLILSQPVESSPDEDILPEVVTPSTMSRAGISSRNVRRQSWMRDSNYDVQGSSSPAGMREAQTDELRYEYRDNSATRLGADVATRHDGATTADKFHKYNSGLHRDKQLAANAEYNRATSPGVEDPFIPDGQDINDVEAEGTSDVEPDDQEVSELSEARTVMDVHRNPDDGTTVQGLGTCSPNMPPTTTIRYQTPPSASHPWPIEKNVHATSSKRRHPYYLFTFAGRSYPRMEQEEGM